ncbi:MAG: helix-turn-helix domain-containing protein [Micromonosporaceae bacterium]
MRRAVDAVPNVVLYNLRDAAGESQQDVADALNDLAAQRAKPVSVTANQISRWERGVVHPSSYYRQLLAKHFNVSVQELGLTRPRVTAAAVAADEREVFGIPAAAPEAPVDEWIRRSQTDWQAVRGSLNRNRVPLAKAAARLYPAFVRLGETGMLAPPPWLPARPIELSAIRLVRDERVEEPLITGTEEESAQVRPLLTADVRHQRYSQAVRDIDHPRLFENRLSWRMLDLAWTGDGAGEMRFGTTTYFSSFDISEAVAHEMAMTHVCPDGAVEQPTWRGLKLRKLIGGPFDPQRRPLLPSIDTLTIRRDRDGACFVLHDRNASNVAVAGGMLHIMPAGVFQPASILPAAMDTDCDLWRNIMREYSEEFLGNPEHDGNGSPVDYTTEPFASMDRARQDGRARVYCLGVGLDALTLWTEVLTVAVFDANSYDEVFADMVGVNNKGRVIKAGTAHPTPLIPFTEQVIRELMGGGRLAPAAAGCLQLAWEHRRTILGD